MQSSAKLRHSLTLSCRQEGNNLVVPRRNNVARIDRISLCKVAFSFFHIRRAIAFCSVVASARCAVLHAVSRRAQSNLDSRALRKKRRRLCKAVAVCKASSANSLQHVSRFSKAKKTKYSFMDLLS